MNEGRALLTMVIWSRYVVGLATMIIGAGLLVHEWTLDLQQIGGALLCITGWLIIWTIAPLREALWIRRYLANHSKEEAREG